MTSYYFIRSDFLSLILTSPSSLNDSMQANLVNKIARVRTKTHFGLKLMSLKNYEHQSESKSVNHKDVNIRIHT